MTEEQIDSYHAGYIECRWQVIFEIEEILVSKTNLRNRLKSYLYELKEDERREAWECIQKEFPGITKEQYEESLKPVNPLIKDT